MCWRTHWASDGTDGVAWRCCAASSIWVYGRQVRQVLRGLPLSTSGPRSTCSLSQGTTFSSASKSVWTPTSSGPCCLVRCASCWTTDNMAWCRPLAFSGIRGHRWVFSAPHLVVSCTMTQGVGAKPRCSFVSGRQVTGVRWHVPGFRLLTPGCRKTFTPMMLFPHRSIGDGSSRQVQSQAVQRSRVLARVLRVRFRLGFPIAPVMGARSCAHESSSRQFACHVSIVPRMIAKPCTSSGPLVRLQHSSMVSGMFQTPCASSWSWCHCVSLCSFRFSMSPNVMANLDGTSRMLPLNLPRSQDPGGCQTRHGHDLY